MIQRFCFSLAILLVLSYGVVEGLWTDRWFPNKELQEAQEKFARIPKTFGTWVSEDKEVPERQLRQGEIHASLFRLYIDTESGTRLSVMLLAGRPGPISVHSPEVCLGGRGFALVRPAARNDVPMSDARCTYWHGEFKLEHPVNPEDVEMYWSWNPGTGWQAANRPRMEFARNRYLYKLYVSRALPLSGTRGNETGKDTPEDKGPIPAFLQQFLPEVESILFPGS
jgi:hypothetical protein